MRYLVGKKRLGNEESKGKILTTQQYRRDPVPKTPVGLADRWVSLYIDARLVDPSNN